MQAFTALLALALVSYAVATPCSDVCNGACESVQQSVTLFFPQAADVVAPNIATCKQGCNAVCTCTDGCTTRCSTPYQTCLDAARGQYNPLAIFSCQAQYAICAGPCNFQCSVTVVSGVVQQIQGLVSTFTQSFVGMFSNLLGGGATQAPAPAP